MPPKKDTLKKPTLKGTAAATIFGWGNVCMSSASQPSAGGVAAAEHSAAASERTQAEVKVIGAAPARTKSSHEEAPATEQRRGARADDSAATLASAPWNKKKIRSQEVEVIGAAPVQTESSDEEAPATEQRRDERARPKPPAEAPPAKLQRHAGLILPSSPPLLPQPPQQQQRQQQRQQDHPELGGDAFRRTPEDEAQARQHQSAAAAAAEAPQRQQRVWFHKTQELCDAVLNGDHNRAMELAYRYRGKKHELEKLEKAQDQGYYSKK